ncbi:MAG TPA: lipocalin family protein [Pseudomonadales bacterium]|nr:lipocalin family protein [Pseudomonadales bacterium]
MRADANRIVQGAALVSALSLLSMALVGCQTTAARPSLPQAEAVDLSAFMGDWYVLGGILTPFERGAHNAIERYRLRDDGAVATTFRLRRGGFDADLSEFHPTGHVVPDTGNAVWGMQFVWPLRADYRIMRFDPEAGITVIGRRARDYVWIMARTPQLPEARWRELVAFAASAGYDAEQIRRVPQRWPE